MTSVHQGQPTAGALLTLDHITMRFGGIVALNDISLQVEPGSIHAVIGPNGAGKSTLLNVITGIYRPTSGAVRFQETALDRHAPHDICRLGICRTFQNTELFGQMSALENVQIGRHGYPTYGLAGALLHNAAYRQGQARTYAESMALLERVGLQNDRDTPAAALPFGKQRRLEIARALATEPRLLLLDEPAAGLRGAEITQLNDILLDVRRDLGVTILVIDHVMALVMLISDRITVLNFGQKIEEGLPEHVRHSPVVIEAYLGKRRNHAVAA